MRLLWLIDSLTVGGAENLVASFMRRLDRGRFEPQLCCLATISGNALKKELQRDGVATFNLGARSLRDLRAFLRLARFVRAEKIDVIHAHLTYAAIWGGAVSRLTGVPIVASLHVAPPARGTRARILDRIMRMVLNHWSSRVIAVSDDLRNRYLAGGGIDPSKLITVHNGIEIERFAGDRAALRQKLAHELNLPSAAVLAVTVSVLRDGKGIDVLLAAVRNVIARMPNAFFLIVGDGPKRDAWTRMAHDLGVEQHVLWLGHRNDIASILPGCDLFVLPSLDDAFPTVLLEAMAASLPVVASDAGGIPEIVTPGVTGELVPAGDRSRLALAIEEMLRTSERSHLGAMAHSIACRRFSTQAWLDRLTAIYDEATFRRESHS